MNFFEILKNITIPDWFGVYEDDTSCLSPDAEWYEDKVYAAAQEAGIQIDTAWGCSQFVIITKDKEVFKIPFHGFYYEEYDDEYNGEHYDAYFEYFKVNHSERTAELYTSAIVEGVDQFFSGIECVGFSSDGHSIYKQEWAQTYEKTDSHIPSEDSTIKAENLRKNQKIPFYTKWLASAIETYGEGLVKKLLWFINAYDIDDLHRNNYGYNAAGQPVIYDYSGFDGSIIY